MDEQPEEHDKLLWSLHAEIFEQRKYPGRDALVAIIPKGQETSSEVKRVQDETGEGRWYPLDNGWKVVCPYVGQVFDPGLFSIVKNGWDHVHCEGCNAAIDIGGSCWTARTEDGFFVICDACHAKLKSAGG